MRFFACEQDLSHEPPDAPLPDAVASGAEPFLIVGPLPAASRRRFNHKPKVKQCMQLNTHLVFNGQCEEAFRLYERCLNGKIITPDYARGNAGGAARTRGMAQ